MALLHLLASACRVPLYLAGIVCVIVASAVIGDEPLQLPATPADAARRRARSRSV